MSVLRLAASQLRRYPQGFGRALSALEFALNPTKEIVVVGEPCSELASAVGAAYLPDAVVALSVNPSADAGMVQLFAGR